MAEEVITVVTISRTGGPTTTAATATGIATTTIAASPVEAAPTRLLMVLHRRTVVTKTMDSPLSQAPKERSVDAIVPAVSRAPRLARRPADGAPSPMAHGHEQRDFPIQHFSSRLRHIFTSILLSSYPSPPSRILAHQLLLTIFSIYMTLFAM